MLWPMAYLWLIWLLLVTTYDLRQRRVPNWLVLAGVAVAAGALAMNAQPFGVRWPDALTGAALGFGFLLLFYVARLMGAGDVKFAGALGLWVGAAPLLPIWIGASLLAGLHAVLLVMSKRLLWFPQLTAMLSGKPRAAADGTGLPRQTRPIPFAAYLSVAAVVWMAWGRES